MDLTDFSSSLGIGSVDFSLIINKIYYFVGIGLLLAVLVGAVAFVYFRRKKGRSNKESKKVGWWEEVGEKMQPTFMEDVEEIIIPGTMLRVFYGKKRNIWLPRFSRGVTKNLYYVVLTKSGQIVNFELGNLSKNLREADLEFDHTDMLWAAENSREFIKKNYTDKSITWWKLYKDTISTAIMIFVMTFSFVIIIYFMRGIVQDIGAITNQLGSILEKSCSAAQTSGIVGSP